MVIYSGFSTRRQEEKYNQLLKDLLHLLSQIIISYVETTRVISFRQAFEKIQFQICKMDQYKYSDLKVSFEIEPLSQHILNGSIVRQSFSEPPKRKIETKPVFRMKRTHQDHSLSRTIDAIKDGHRPQQSRSLSMNSDKNVNRYVGQRQSREPTMEELMQMNPLIERKMSGYRKRRYLKQRNNFPQIKEEEQNIDELE